MWNQFKCKASIRLQFKKEFLIIKSMDVTRYVKILAREPSEIDDTVLQKVMNNISNKIKINFALNDSMEKEGTVSLSNILMPN